VLKQKSFKFFDPTFVNIVEMNTKNSLKLIKRSFTRMKKKNYNQNNYDFPEETRDITIDHTQSRNDYLNNR